jgi:hypothetical protein
MIVMTIMTMTMTIMMMTIMTMTIMINMKGMTMTTNPTPSARPKKAGASRNSKVISTGLAVATGVGIAGMVAVRMAQDVSAQSNQVDSQPVSVTTSTAGYTQAQLDAYAQALATEAQKLRQYRDQLVQVAETLQVQTTNPQNTQTVQHNATPAQSQSKPKNAAPAAIQSKSTAPTNSAPAASAAQAPAAQQTPAAAPAPQIQTQKPASQATSKSS